MKNLSSLLNQMVHMKLAHSVASQAVPSGLITTRTPSVVLTLTAAPAVETMTPSGPKTSVTTTQAVSTVVILLTGPTNR